jgi:hypothetical protein
MVRNLQKPRFLPVLALRFCQMSKRFGPPRFKGSTQEKSVSEIFRFGYGKGLNDKKVPDPVGSGFFVLQKVLTVEVMFGRQ